MLDWLAIRNRKVVERFNRIKKQDNPFNNPNRACRLSIKISGFIQKSRHPSRLRRLSGFLNKSAAFIYDVFYINGKPTKHAPSCINICIASRISSLQVLFLSSPLQIRVIVVFSFWLTCCLVYLTLGNWWSLFPNQIPSSIKLQWHSCLLWEEDMCCVLCSFSITDVVTLLYNC